MSTKDLIISDNYMTEFEVAENGAVIIRQVDALTLTPNTVALSAADLARLRALLAPEPEPSDAEIEYVAETLYRDEFGYDASLIAAGDSDQLRYRHMARIALEAAARAARQTGGGEK
jgi:hypothetical protein